MIIFRWCIHFGRYFWPCYCPEKFNEGTVGTAMGQREDRAGQEGKNMSVLWEGSRKERARSVQL